MAQIDDAVTALGSTAKAFWKLNEASGTSCADTVGSHTLTASAGVTLGSTQLLTASGDSSTSAYLNGGSTGRLTSTWTSGDIPTTLTIFMVVNPNASVPSLHETGVGLYASSGTRFAMFVKRNSSPYYMASWNSSGSQWLQCDVANGIIPRSAISTLAWTHNGTQVKFYVNGVLEATKTSNALASTYVNVIVGTSQTTGSDPFRGNVSSVLLASPLSDAQITGLHNAATSVLSDTTAPSVPTNLTVNTTNIFGGSISWTASTDDTAVTGYQVRVDSTDVGTTSNTNYTVTNLNPNTAHTVQVRAYDAASNYSAYCSTVALNTNALSGPVTELDSANKILVSHRGGAALYPSETMTAYQQTANAYPVVLEGDVHLAVADGTYTTEFDRMVLLHSPTMGDDGIVESDGTTSCTHSIWSTTVTSFIAHKMPWPTSGSPANLSRWSELFSHLVTNNQVCLIEPKHGAAQTAILNAARTQVGGEYLIEYLLHNSFTYTECVEAAAIGMRTQWVTSSFATHSATECATDGIHSIAFAAGTSGWESLVTTAHAAGIKAYVWTITSQSQADTYLAGGVDGIIADDPTISVIETNDGVLSAATTLITSTIAGTQTNIASLSAQLLSNTANIVGTQTNVGSINASLSLVSANIVGTQTTSATLNASSYVVTSSISASQVNNASLDANLPVVTCYATGELVNYGTLNTTSSLLTFSSIGTQVNIATLEATTTLITSYITSSDSANTASLNVNTHLLTSNIIGTQVNVGELTAETALVTANVTGQLVNSCVLNANLYNLVLTAEGTQTNFGNLTAVTNLISSNISDETSNNATINVSTHLLTSDITGTQVNNGTLNTSLTNLISNITGVQVSSGVLNTNLYSLVSNIIGASYNNATLNASTYVITALISDQAYITGSLNAQTQLLTSTIVGNSVNNGLLITELYVPTSTIIGTQTNYALINAEQQLILSNINGNSTNVGTLNGLLAIITSYIYDATLFRDLILTITEPDSTRLIVTELSNNRLVINKPPNTRIILLEEHDYS